MYYDCYYYYLVHVLLVHVSFISTPTLVRDVKI